MFTFNPTLTLDGILQIAVFVGGGLFAFFRLRSDFMVLSLRVDHIEGSTQSISDTIQKVAVQDNRLLNIENDIRDLRRAKEYVAN